MTDKEIKQLFEKDSSEAAEELIGKIISYDGKKIRITETEAYGDNDPFCYGVRYGKTVKKQRFVLQRRQSFYLCRYAHVYDRKRVRKTAKCSDPAGRMLG